MKNLLFQSGVLLHGGRCRTQNAGFLRSFSVVLFLLPLLFAHTANGDTNAELVDAVKRGGIAKVEHLLKQGVDVNAETEDGETALMAAAYRGHTETLKVLIEAGAEVNAKDEDGRTALMFAEGAGRTETLKVLMELGADVNAK